MSVISINDQNFINTDEYKNFMKENPSFGILKIRANVAGVKVVVTKKIGSDTVIFFEGVTDESGMINNIKLPTPEAINDDLVVPPSTTYEVDATYTNEEQIYPVNVFSGIYVVQTIKITPVTEMRNYYGY